MVDQANNWDDANDDDASDEEDDDDTEEKDDDDVSNRAQDIKHYVGTNQQLTFDYNPFHLLMDDDEEAG